MACVKNVLLTISNLKWKCFFFLNCIKNHWITTPPTKKPHSNWPDWGHRKTHRQMTTSVRYCSSPWKRLRWPCTTLFWTYMQSWCFSPEEIQSESRLQRKARCKTRSPPELRWDKEPKTESAIKWQSQTCLPGCQKIKHKNARCEWIVVSYSNGTHKINPSAFRTGLFASVSLCKCYIYSIYTLLQVSLHASFCYWHSWAFVYPPLHRNTEHIASWMYHVTLTQRVGLKRANQTPTHFCESVLSNISILIQWFSAPFPMKVK